MECFKWKYFRGMFGNCFSLRDISPLKNWYMTYQNDLRGMFNGCVGITPKSLLSLSEWEISEKQLKEMLSPYNNVPITAACIIY